MLWEYPLHRPYMVWYVEGNSNWAAFYLEVCKRNLAERLREGCTGLGRPHFLPMRAQVQSQKNAAQFRLLKWQLTSIDNIILYHSIYWPILPGCTDHWCPPSNPASLRRRLQQTKDALGNGGIHRLTQASHHARGISLTLANGDGRWRTIQDWRENGSLHEVYHFCAWDWNYHLIWVVYYVALLIFAASFF